MSNIKSIAAALIKAKSNFPAIYKTSLNPHFKAKYASLDVILEAIDKPLANAGILLIQPTIIRDGITYLSTQLIHAESGESIESELIIPAQSDPQKLGAAMTYYRRFSLCSILSIAAEPDDDGNTAVGNTAPAKKPDEAISKAREALKDCMEILSWDNDRKSAWAKTINPQPYANWSLKDWELGVVRAHLEIDRANS